MQEYPHTLLATLGSQPHFVTFTLDLLLHRGFPINEVIAVHPAPTDSCLQHAITSLQKQFADGNYFFAEKTYRCCFRSHFLTFNGQVLDDVEDTVSATGTLDTMHHLIRDLKQQNHHVHLSITGGRRLMSLLAISGALLHFRQNIDHIWHISIPQEIQKQATAGTMMHALPYGEVRLIEVPFVPWGEYFPNLPSQDAGARTVLNTQIAQMEDEKRKHCDVVMRQITPRQREVLQAFASGLGPQEVADKLHITIKTVDAHKTKLLDLCRETWNIKTSSRLDYHFFYRNFATYFIEQEHRTLKGQTY